jgi:hypothetical protein
MKTCVKNGIAVREDEILDGFVVVDTYTPCHSVTPWDYYGGKHQREMITVLKAAGIRGIALETKRKVVDPVGTGPGGMVRFGDDMVPSTYRVIVTAKEENAARAAIANYRYRLEVWLHDGGPRPMELS